MRSFLLDALLKGKATISPPEPGTPELEEVARTLSERARRRLGRSLSIREIDAGSCNGCELEIHAINNPVYDIERFGLKFVASPRHADVLLITGATLLNDTLEDLLALARPKARVTVLGPTVGMLPDAFMARGADCLGTVRITRPDAFLDLLAEAGSAPHFLGHSAEKIVLARRPAVAPAKVA